MWRTNVLVWFLLSAAACNDKPSDSWESARFSRAALSANIMLPSSPALAPIDESAAVRLYNGKVLILGGRDNYGESGLGASSSAELYDPTANSWKLVTFMISHRLDYVATLLSSGKVLVSGGRAVFDQVEARTIPVDWVDLYDPVADAWAQAAPMSTPRQWHAANLLLNGQVLVSGGYSGDTPGTSAELYDPIKGSWTPTAPMSTARHMHQATRLDNGMILVSGGLSSARSYPTISLSSAELYDPATGHWMPTGSMSTPRYDHSAVLLGNGKVLVSGGLYTYNSHIASAELYDPSTGQWTSAGSMSTTRVKHTATLLRNGTALVSGGNSAAQQALTSAEIYDPVAGNWTSTAPLSTPRASHTATRLGDGKVFVYGERGEVYDTDTATWTLTTPVSSAQ